MLSRMLVWAHFTFGAQRMISRPNVQLNGVNSTCCQRVVFECTLLAFKCAKAELTRITTYQDEYNLRKIKKVQSIRSSCGIYSVKHNPIFTRYPLPSSHFTQWCVLERSLKFSRSQLSCCWETKTFLPNYDKKLQQFGMFLDHCANTRVNTFQIWYATNNAKTQCWIK